MKADPQFVKQSHEFWACVKLINQKLRYAKDGFAIVPPKAKVKALFKTLNLDDTKLFNGTELTKFGEHLFEYLTYRAGVLNNQVKGLLMDVDEARAEYDKLKARVGITIATPINKQTQEKANPAYFTGIVNMLIASNLKGHPVNYNPQQITAFLKNNFPALSLSRRVDGTFPHPVDPIAIWEIKEYYYTTTFGSRIADGVYETMLDGYELHEARDLKQRPLFHYLMTDSHRTWWLKGIPYLCRMIDMIHMELVTECLFGKEVFQRIPEIVPEWIEVYEKYKHEYPANTAPEILFSESSEDPMEEAAQEEGDITESGQT
ncbi:MAG: hypothetical protein ABWZ25_10030 [Chitinophagaceae bacterium]